MLKISMLFTFSFAVMTMGTTLSEKPEIYFEWKIANFFDFTTEGNYILASPQFSFANTRWLIMLFTNGSILDQSRGFISMYLEKVYPEEERQVDFTLGIKKPDGFDFAAKKGGTQIFNKMHPSHGCNKVMERSELLLWRNSVAPEGTLVVFCRAHIIKSREALPQVTLQITPQTTPNGTGNLNDGTKDLYVDFKDLYTSKRFSDVKLIVKNREFYAHKNILSCRFTTFASMGENIPDKVEITGVNPDSFEEFLLFVYTGKLDKISSMKAMSLYQTAGMYNLRELKEKCAQSIADNNLNIGSFYDILDFASLHSDNLLLRAVTEFLITNAKHILPTEKWEKFVVNDPLHVNKLLLKYAEYKK